MFVSKCVYIIKVCVFVSKCVIIKGVSLSANVFMLKIRLDYVV